jgi:hypothetical protein
MLASANKFGKVLRVLTNLAAINLALWSYAATGLMFAFLGVHGNLPYSYSNMDAADYLRGFRRLAIFLKRSKQRLLASSPHLYLYIAWDGMRCDEN